MKLARGTTQLRRLQAMMKLKRSTRYRMVPWQDGRDWIALHCIIVLQIMQLHAIPFIVRHVVLYWRQPKKKNNQTKKKKETMLDWFQNGFFR